MMDANEVVMPKHIAIIMDGNGRWAEKRFLPRALGHQAGVKVVRKIVEYCAQQQIKVLSLFAFSSENWLSTRRSSLAHGLIYVNVTTGNK